MDSLPNSPQVRQALAALESERQRSFQEMGRAIQQIQKTLLPAAAPRSRQSSAKSRQQLHVSRETLTVEWRGRHCFLGNTLLFFFFERLARSPNRYVSHHDLLEEVWGGERQASTIRGVAKRLRDQLAAAGMPELAAAIDGTINGHYCLKLSKK